MSWTWLFEIISIRFCLIRCLSMNFHLINSIEPKFLCSLSTYVWIMYLLHLRPNKCMLALFVPCVRWKYFQLCTANVIMTHIRMIFYVATLLSFMIHLILCFSCIFICMLSAWSYVLGYVFTNDICSKQSVYLWKFFQAKHLLLKFLKIGSPWRTLALNRWKDRFKPKSTHLCTIFPWVLIFRETLYVYFSQIWYVFDYCFF